LIVFCSFGMPTPRSFIEIKNSSNVDNGITF
jgi:hypothetical protein